MTLPRKRWWLSIQPYSDSTGGRGGVRWVSKQSITFIIPCSPPLQTDGKSLKTQSVLDFVNVSSKDFIPGQPQSFLIGKVSMKRSTRISLHSSSWTYDQRLWCATVKHHNLRQRHLRSFSERCGQPVSYWTIFDKGYPSWNDVGEETCRMHWTGFFFLLTTHL